MDHKRTWRCETYKTCYFAEIVGLPPTSGSAQQAFQAFSTIRCPYGPLKQSLFKCQESKKRERKPPTHKKIKTPNHAVTYPCNLKVQWFALFPWEGGGGNHFSVSETQNSEWSASGWMECIIIANQPNEAWDEWLLEVLDGHYTHAEGHPAASSPWGSTSWQRDAQMERALAATSGDLGLCLIKRQ